jgi:hypothetical protein
MREAITADGPVHNLYCSNLVARASWVFALNRSTPIQSDFRPRDRGKARPPASPLRPHPPGAEEGR